VECEILGCLAFSIAGLRPASAARREDAGAWIAGHSTAAGCTWVVALHAPEDQNFYGKTLEEALAWCLVRLMAPELGVGPFLVCLSRQCGRAPSPLGWNAPAAPSQVRGRWRAWGMPGL
jgi:hypothetical protein